MHLLVFGLGYCGAAVAIAARAQGITVSATSRDPARIAVSPEITLLPFGASLPRDVTHVLATAPPDEDGDPVLRLYASALRATPTLRWAGYLSTTGVYGDRAGSWVDEAAVPAPGNARSHRRVAAEAAWSGLSRQIAVDLFRVAGIYGPGRSAFDALRAGRARRVLKPGHAFGRIHRDDIVGAVLAAVGQTLPPGIRILHLADDTPSENAAVIEAAAEMLGVAPPPAIPFAQAVTTMSAMGRSFWAENRKVASHRTQEILGYRWRYPGYRDGLRAILADEIR